ncbi:MAG: nucleoside permease [Cloacibacterium sp.]|nr:nucleoside permease [Cloacibacterium sp.]
MNLKLRLTVLSFLQFFVWGAWLISLGGYLFVTLKFTGSQIGQVFATLGIASFFMPTIVGIIADKYINAQKLLGILHILGAGLIYLASTYATFDQFYLAVLGVSLLYMPTIPLSYSVSYSILEKNNYDTVKTFPNIRVWGTVGFIVALWITDLAGFSFNKNQFILSAVAGIALGIYSFTLPNVETSKVQNKTWVQTLGLDAFRLFREKRMFIFFLFSVLIGCCLQITNAFGKTFIDDFKAVPEFAETFAVQHSGIIISISQISETLFILAIPYFLKKFGIKKVMIMSIIAWVFRFAFFVIAQPSGLGLVFLISSMVIYGMAFDFFLISGSLFIEKESPKEIRSSAQGLFMMMSNGLGAIIGGYLSGKVVDYFTTDGVKDWSSIWLTFAIYAAILVVLFPIFFKYKHRPEEIGEVSH